MTTLEPMRLLRAVAGGTVLLLVATACPEPPAASDASAADAHGAADASQDAAAVDAAFADRATPDALGTDQGGDDAAVAPECQTSADCDGESATQGYLCLSGACVRCASNNQCAVDEHYGDQARCSSGRCNSCPEGNPGCPCLQSGACAGTLQCVSGTCLDCTRGSEGCRCYSNATCDGTLVCSSDVCAPCAPGSLGCGCDQGACQGDLACSNNTCVPRTCPAGEEGCACDGSSCALGLYCTGASLCAACVDDVVGCPCSAGACEGGLVCDGSSALCREPVLCAAAGCGANQRCDEPAGEDAVCLQDCVTGFFWESSSASCQALRPNCEPGAEGSILAVCDALRMTCVATSSGATCDGCLDGAKPVSASVTDGCRLPYTCDLWCAPRSRACQTEASGLDDAVCGDCTGGLLALDPGDLEKGCSDAVYADPAAAMGGTGSKEAPLRNLAVAVTTAATAGLDVRAATGSFQQTARIALQSHVDIVGGYDPATWQPGSERTVVVVDDNVALQGIGVDDVLLERLDVASAGAWGSPNGFGLLVRNSSALTVRDCALRARAGNAGASGTSQHDAAQAGTAGTQGVPGLQIDTPVLLPGGPGGSCPCSASGAGGAGGTSNWGMGAVGLPGFAPASGTAIAGLGEPGGLGNNNPELQYVGGDGADGAPGSDGQAVSGTFANTYYRVPTSESGGPGHYGLGGAGGGGGGGGTSGGTSHPSTGSSGGGGGGGGCGGLAGGGGTGGGGSFGLYIFDSSFSVEDCLVVTGDGGDGGAGGQGQPGGAGGRPGMANAASPDNHRSVPYSTSQGTASNGGRGGYGGDGGRGGHGAGGAGGPSIGIVVGGTASGTVQHNTYEIGNGGQGGTSAGHPGPDGLSLEQYTP